MRRRVAIVCAGLVLASCFTRSFVLSARITDEQKAAIEIGRTTKDDLLRELGDPDRVRALGPGRERFTYINEKEIGRFTGFALFPILGAGSVPPTEIARSELWIVLTDDVVEALGERPLPPEAEPAP